MDFVKSYFGKNEPLKSAFSYVSCHQMLTKNEIGKTKSEVDSNSNWKNSVAIWFLSFMCGSCHIRNVLIGIKFRNCCWFLDLYLLFAT